MDLQTAIAASMLPASRAVVAATFKQLQDDGAAGAGFLELLWAACRRGRAPGPRAVQDLLDAADSAVESARSAGVEPIALFDSRYPPLLACTTDPPPVVWIRGHPEVLSRPTVALIGSRAATPYALDVGQRLGRELAARDVAVVSGLARGVDSAAHRGCLAAGGATVAVLGSGIDRVYPPEHAALAAEIVRTGALLTELAPGAPPLPEHFPLRNRIISGISLATVVVEASEQSGSLITARCALEQGRDVMAVPGNVLSGRNRGAHALLKEGATVVETADDILRELGWNAGPDPSPSAKSLISEPLLSSMEPGEAYGLDELVGLTGMNGARILARLTQLELAGLVDATNGRYARRG